MSTQGHAKCNNMSLFTLVEPKQMFLPYCWTVCPANGKQHPSVFCTVRLWRWCLIHRWYQIERLFHCRRGCVFGYLVRMGCRRRGSVRAAVMQDSQMPLDLASMRFQFILFLLRTAENSSHDVTNSHHMWIGGISQVSFIHRTVIPISESKCALTENSEFFKFQH